MRRRAGEQGGTGSVLAYAARPEKLGRARLFRHAPTSAEAMLWQRLRRKVVGGIRFRRQHVIAGYVVDFYCPALRLALEVDGGVHQKHHDRDERRTVHLSRLGVTVLRIANARVLSDLAGVVQQVLQACEAIGRGAGQLTAPSLAQTSAPRPPFPPPRGKGAGG
jgi:very-short-patch-repair endonuclease